VADTWGFAAISDNIDPSLQVGTALENFTSVYEPNDASNIFAELPNTDTTIYETIQLPGQIDEITFYYGANVTNTMMAGVYSAEITYTVVSADVPEPPCGLDFEVICYSIDMQYSVTQGVHEIGTGGYVASMFHDYDWDVFIDGQPITSCGGGNRCAGTGSSTDSSIVIAGLSDEVHLVKILPHSGPEAGWGNAFNLFKSTGTPEVISIDAPITTMAFAPKTSDSTTSASGMFAELFSDCIHLTTGATIVDTYRLPNTITDLSGFMWSIHENSPELITPVNISSLSGWLVANNVITNLSYFLASSHGGNDVLEETIDLTPMTGWFSNNTSITNISNFLSGTYANDYAITTPTNLTPTSGWFAPNRSFTSLGSFLFSTHYDNTSLLLKYGQTPIFPNWLKTVTQAGTPILDVSNFARRAFYLEALQIGNTGEPTFEDGKVLSELGAPSGNKQTYTNRDGISAVYPNWK